MNPLGNGGGGYVSGGKGSDVGSSGTRGSEQALGRASSFRPPPALSPRNGPGDDDSRPSEDDTHGGRFSGESVHVTEARRAAIAMQERVERQLDQVKNMYDEYFDDAGFDLSRPLAKPRPATLPELVTYVKQVPTAGRPATFERKTQEVKAQSAVARFQSLGSLIHTQAVDRALFRQDTIVCGLSVFGVLLVGISSLIGWVPRRRLDGKFGSCQGPEPGYVPGKINDVSKASIEVLTYLILFSSIATIVGIVRYYAMITRAKQIEWCKINGKEVMKRAEAWNFWRSRYPLFLAAEILVHVVMPYPFYNSQTVTDDSVNNSKYLELFVLTRVYTILRVMHHASPLYRLRHDIVAATPELKRANFTVRFTDTLKVYCYEYTIVFGLVLYAFVAFIGGFAVFVAERDSNNGCDPIPAPPGVDGFGFNSWPDGIYFMVVSVRTIGYGDLKPITIVGRIATMVFVLAGMFVEAFLGSVVINKIAQSREEKITDEYLDTIRAFIELRVRAAMLIQALWKSSLRYKYRHNMVSRQVIEDVLRRQKRRRDFLAKIKTSTVAFQTPAYQDLHDETKALKLTGGTMKTQDTPAFAIDVALRTLIAHFKTRTPAGRKRRGFMGESSSARDRMPYLRRTEELSSSSELVKMHSLLFTQDFDTQRWIEKAKELENKKSNFRTFTSTKRMVGAGGKERRVPVGEGHKSDILLEARKKFRAARLNFTSALSQSADFVIDQKLLTVFKLLSAASEKVTRNAIALDGLRKSARLQLDAVDELVTLALSGGDI